MADAFAQTSPTLARWVTTHGWIEVGDDGLRRPFVRVPDDGGLLRAGDAAGTVDDGLRAADAAVGDLASGGVGPVSPRPHAAAAFFNGLAPF